MDCRESKRLIQMELDGEISPADARRLAEHVEVCDACAAEREEMLALERELVDLPIERAPGNLVREVVESIEKERVAGRWIEPAIIGASVVGATTAAVVGVVRATGSGRPRGLWQFLQDVPSWLESRVGAVVERMPGVEAAELEPGIAIAIGAVSIVVASLVAVAVVRFLRDSSRQLRNGECR